MHASKQKTILSSILLLLIAFNSASAIDLFVSPTGDDSNPGTQESPLASLVTARDKARQFAGKEAVTIHFADGVYYLPETLVLAPEDSGSAANPVAYKATTEGGAILSGGSALELTWEAHENGIFKARTPDGLTIDQVFVDGTNQRMARYPNFDPAKKAEPYQGNAADAFSKERAAKWSDPTGAYMHVMHRAQWGGYQYQITGKDKDGELTYEGGWQNNRPGPMHEQYRMVEHVFEELDAPGEWFHDQKTSTLYYKPEAGLDLNKAKVEVVRLRHLIEFKGTESNPVKFVSLQGFTVRHASRTFMDTKEPMVRSDWTIYRGGAIMLTGTEDVSILDCEFDQVGGNAIFVNNYNRRTQVKGCHIHDVGASGVCFVGDPNALRDPLFRHGEKNELDKIDRTPGPKTNNYPANGSVEDCLIHGIGTVERQPAGVQIEMAAEITISDCSVYDTSRAGINIGDGAFGGHLIQRCDVFDTVLETHDHGSFNSWGRDRYWRSDHLTATQKAVDEDPKLPFLDAIKTTVIRDSRWRCDHGWDIDLDDGTSNYDIYNNLMLNKGLKLREGFRRHAWNNVMPVGWFHPHVWFLRSNDQVYANIFSNRHSPARMSTPYTDGETMVDRNLFDMNDEKVLEFSARLGWDENSLVGDPMYVDPANGDFRVKEGSPALKLGFKNFPMDQFGVKKPSLKAIARTPEIPSLKQKSEPTRKQPPLAKETRRVWQGAILKDLSGEEFSAYGVSKEEGGVALVDVPKNSVAAKAGLLSGDLIQGINGKPVSTLKNFLRKVSRNSDKVLKLKVIRDQKEMELEIQPASKTLIETSANAEGFKTLPAPAASNRTVTASGKTSNEPLASLTDGKLVKNFGPVFPNGVAAGAYKMDLGSSQEVTAINSWSHNENGRRGAQLMTVYGSDSVVDPGWDLKQKFQALGSFDTGAVDNSFAAVSLQAVDGKSLGKFRWIVWAVSPVDDNDLFENSAIQELSVETLNLNTNATSTNTSAQQAAAQNTPAHLFILSGQSNMVGLDPNISFTPAVTEAFGSDSVIVIKDAANGQPISRWYKDWKSAQGQPAKPGQQGDLYERLKKKLTAAVKGRDLETVTLVWMQGEADASRNQTAVYRESLEGLLNQLRRDFKRDDIHFVLGRLSDYSLDTGKHPQWQAMRDLQVEFAESNPLGEWVDTDDLNNKTDRETSKPRDDVHYTKEGYQIFGQRLADKAIALIQPSSLPGKMSDFHGYKSHRFQTTGGADVEVICPTKAAAGKPWLWRSLFWKSVKPVHEADLKLVDQGYHVVLVHGDVAGHPKGNANIDAAYELLTSEYGFAKKCSMASISRGTLSLFRWAAANPEKVNSIYVDNGVCNIKSWPAGKLVAGSGSQASGAAKSWKNFKETFGYATDADALDSKQSPIDQLEPLAKAGVPILMVCGSKDTAVPYEENDAILEQRYRALGGPIEVIVEDKGHSHGMKDPTPVINFIKTNSQPSAIAAQDKADKKPNVVFLMTDDQRWDTFGCYGRPEFRTENIDKLSRDGVTFDNAYYAVAICMPSRTTMMTGRYISDHQVGFTCPYNRTLPEEEFADSYPAQMKAAGYRTGFVGKFGIRAQNMRNTMPKYFDFFAVGGMRWPKDDAELMNIYREDRPKTDRTIKKGDAMIHFLDTQPKDQPFCLSISFDAVKNDNDQDMVPAHVDVFKENQMSVPGNWVEGKSDRLPPLLDYWRGTYLHVARSSTPAQYQTLARRFATQGYTVDLQVGRLMKKLKEMGVLENTIVIYTSDNGRFHGSQGLFDKAILYEESVKEPLIVYDGRAPKERAGKRVDAFVSSTDMAPTILSLVGLDVPKRMKGHSFTGLLDGTQDMSKWQDAVLMESLFLQDMHAANVKKHPDLPGLNKQIIANNQSYRCRGVRSGKWKYFVYYEHTPPIEELYDLEADPLEQKNLAGEADYEKVVDELRTRTEELYIDATQ